MILRSNTPLALVLALLALLIPLTLAGAQDDQEGQTPTVEEDIAALEKRPQSADMSLVQRLGESGELDAGRALLEHHEEFTSLGARLAALDGLGAFVDTDEIGVRAAEALRDVATAALEPELREAALRALAVAGERGRATLAAILEAPVDDEVRLRAMTLHVERATKDDDAFYERLWRGKREGEPLEDDDKKKKRKKSKKDEEVEKRARTLAEIRRQAFLAIAERLDDDTLLEARRSFSATIRRESLRLLLKRKHEQALPTAQAVFENRNEFGDNRVLAAEALLQDDRDEWIGEVIEEGERHDAGMKEREDLAGLVARFGDDEIFGDIARKLTRGQDAAVMFRIFALERYKDEKYDKKLEKLLKEKNSAVRYAVIRILGKRRALNAVEDLEKMLSKSEDPTELSHIVRSLSELYRKDKEWMARIAEFARSEQQSLRNAALKEAVELEVSGLFELLEDSAQHPDWATRRLAIGALAEIGDRSSVEVLIGRVEFEVGRLAAELEDYLWELTGKPFGRNARAWNGWWEKEGKSFKPIGRLDLRELEKERERRRLEESSASPQFFGLRIISHSVTFVIDVSGSMEEPTKTSYAGEAGPPRFEVAVRELRRAIERLENTANFNILSFSSDVVPLSEQLTQATSEGKEAAFTFIDGLRASGGTNLFGALETAFEDAEMDTLIVLSDGEPSAGDITNPEAIRRVVAQWNENRGVKIHTVQIGASLQILSWLSEDSGGNTIAIP